MSEFERRYTAGRVELRARKDKPTIGGYAAKFNRESRNLGGFIEVIDPRFFNQSRGDGWPEVIARYNHDDNMLLGTTAAGTLRLNVDSEGLVYEVDPPQSRSDIVELVDRGDVQKSSFAFRAFEDEWSTNDQGFPLRTLIAGHLVDVAPVNTPAYLDTSAGLRSFAEKFHADLEEVRKLAAADELVKFLKRSDGKPIVKRPLFGAAALTSLPPRPRVG